MGVDASLSGIVEHGHASAGSLEDFPSVWSVGVDDWWALIVDWWVRSWENVLAVGAVVAIWTGASAICWWFWAVDDWAIIQVNASTISKQFLFISNYKSFIINESKYLHTTNLVTAVVDANQDIIPGHRVCWNSHEGEEQDCDCSHFDSSVSMFTKKLTKRKTRVRGFYRSQRHLSRTILGYLFAVIRHVLQLRFISAVPISILCKASSLFDNAE